MNTPACYRYSLCFSHAVFLLASSGLLFLPLQTFADEDCTPQVEGFSVWDTDADTHLFTMVNNDLIDLNDFDSHITIVAEANSCTKSASFFLNGENVKTENAAPFVMTGDNSGDLHPWLDASTGSYNLSVTPFSQTGTSGTEGSSRSISFDVISEGDCLPAIGTVSLYDADSNAKIKSLFNGSEIDLTDLPGNLSIGTDANECTASVAIAVNGSHHRVENAAPYMIDGDDDGDIFPSDLITEGNLSVSFKPWSEDNEGGLDGSTRTLNLTITDGRIKHVVSNDPDDYMYLSARYSNPISRLKPGPSAYSPEFGDAQYTAHGGDLDEYDSPANDTYYQTVDPDGLRTTLDDWKKLHGMINQFGTPNSDVINAKYVNAYDLGFGRDMYCLETSSFESQAFPCVVENYQVTGSNTKFIASVAMERVFAQSNSGASRFYTAFFVFDAKGRRINSIDLDGKGSKRVPEACWACHDGGASFIGSRGGQYLGFDKELFRNFPGAPTVSQQSSNFAKLNIIVKKIAQAETSTTYDSDNHVNIKKLIQRFEINKPVSKLTGAPASHQSNGQAEIYSKYCRTCHVSQTPFTQPGEGGETFAYLTYGEDLPNPDGTPGKFNCLMCHQPTNLDSLGSVKGFYNTPQLDYSEAGKFKEVVCGQFDADAVTLPSKQMPNALVTHKRLIEEHTSGGAHGFRSVKNGSPIKTTFGCNSIPDLR